MTAGLSGLSGRLRRQCVRRGDRGDGLPGNGDIALSNALGRYYIAAANDDIEHAPSQDLHGFTGSPSAGATHERAEAGSVEALVHANPIGR